MENILHTFLEILADKNTVKYIALFVSIFFYIVSLTQFNSSTRSCFKNNPTKNKFFPLAILYFTLLTSVIFLTLFISTIGDNKEPFPIIILIYGAACTIFIGLYYFTTCSSDYKNNLDLLNYLNLDQTVLDLQSIYEQLMFVQPVSRCISFHTGNYRISKNTKCIMPENCDAITSTSEMCNNTGAKLVEFYVAASHQSCLMPITSEHYVSTEMLKTVLIAGARFIDISIYDEIINNDIIPVVRSNYNDKLSSNYLLLDDVYSVIKNNAFLNPESDPLLIHFNIMTQNIAVIDNIARSFSENLGEYILDNKDYHYDNSASNAEIIKQPICEFINKIILCVTTDSDLQPLGELDELVNIRTSVNAKKLSIQDAITTEVFDNQNIYTMVTPDETIDTDSIERAYDNGCHAIMMNYFDYYNIQNLMTYYCNFFVENKSSFVLKAIELQEVLVQ